MIPDYLYSSIYLYSVIILTLFASSSIKQSYNQIAKGNKNFPAAIIICFVFALFLGSRPNTRYFGDTFSYTHTFTMIQTGKDVYTEVDGEWIWRRIMHLCAQYMNVNDYFTVIDIGYLGFTLWACKRLTPNNVLVSLLFCMGALSFYTYGINGIRNGLACSIVLLYFSYLNGNAKDKIIAAILAFCAYNIHHSTMLPIVISIISLFVIRSFKQAYIFWLLSIIISLIAGDAITAAFATLGFDDRLSYLTHQDDVFSHSGFRFDFLIYSMMPIVLGYYVVIKRGIQNKTYLLLLNTYTLTNAFWVMVIRANYSNRFAYLSWFMYPIVLSYPLLKLDIWEKEQGIYLKRIMLAQIGFTWFMKTFYW